MAALSDNFAGWRMIPGTGELCIEAAVAGADEFYRGAIATVAVGAGLLIKVTNGVTTDIPFGIVEKRTTATGASSHTIPCWVRGVVYFTGVAAIATASGLPLLYALANSDNPADLTATAAGNTSAFGRVIAIETTAVSGYVDMTQKAVVAETA
jgi:hypothetical protein